MLLARDNNSIKRYLQEGLLALVPVYDNGYKSEVITRQGRYQEARSVLALVTGLAAAYSYDLPALRRRCSALLGVKHHITLALGENLVLLPVKVRHCAVPGEMTIGYANMGQIEVVLPAESGETALSRIIFEGGVELLTINTVEKIKKRLEHGETVLKDFQARRSQGFKYVGLKRQFILDQLPTCECLLKDLFIDILDLEGKNKFYNSLRATAEDDLPPL